MDSLNISDEYKTYINNFIQNDEVKDISKAITYKEHEFKYSENGITKTGIIDLLVEYDDHIDIIDYKTNNIDSEEYKNQLNGYKEYISTLSNKTINIYLYSIKKDEFTKI